MFHIVHIHIYTHTHTHMHTAVLYTCNLYIYIYICMYIYIYAYVNIYTYIYICICKYIYIYIYVCISYITDPIVPPECLMVSVQCLMLIPPASGWVPHHLWRRRNRRQWAPIIFLLGCSGSPGGYDGYKVFAIIPITFLGNNGWFTMENPTNGIIWLL